MELEEAIKRLKDLVQDIEHRKMDCEAIETVLNQLEQYKRLAEMNLKDSEEFQNNMCEHRCILYNEKEELKADLYEANNIISDYIDITTKQEKMMDKMISMLEDYGADEFICNEVSKILYKNNKICNGNCKECIKQYFEKKAEEDEKNV